MKNLMENISEKIFYHIYPLGLCGCPQKNDFSQAAGDGLAKLTEQIPEIKKLGINAIYIGPLFESSAHGYDTVDYFYVDRRLGNNNDFANFVKKCHENETAVIVDAVFNHTGRDFFAFKDLQKNGIHSKYASWYLNVNFSNKSPYNDDFSYEGWAGCMDLCKLNLENPEVQNHLFEAVKTWVNLFDIDGLRLDAADVLSKSFLEKLKAFCSTLKPNFWLMGEVVHGNYADWVQKNRIDSVTNYELYKGMWSSFNDFNFFEIAYSLKRQFGTEGIYKDFILYNFLDNHDVNRICSVLKNKTHIFPLYGLLFTVPGVPSIYYGSEKGICGQRNDNGDHELRPCLPPFNRSIPTYAHTETDSENLFNTIQTLCKIRTEQKALQKGNYLELLVSSKQFAFAREYDNDKIIVILNSDTQKQNVKINDISGTWEDLLNGGIFNDQDFLNLEIPSCWLRILKKK